MKVKCQGCTDRFPKEEAYRRVGLGYVCSEECLFTVMNKSQDRARKTTTKAMRDDIPTAVRSEVLERDDHQCRRCGAREDLHPHHINYKSEGVDHSPGNLITLCGAGNVDGCHGIVHSRKRIYKPILLAIIWMQYVENQYLNVSQMARVLSVELPDEQQHRSDGPRDNRRTTAHPD